MNRRLQWTGLKLFLITGLSVCAQPSGTLVYSDAVDGSAAVPVGVTHYVAATDEDNILRVYMRDAGGLPVRVIDLSSFLQVDAESPETDIEGAALISSRAYWITAHARDKRGRLQPSRQRLFATDVVTNGGGIQVTGAGRPYTQLLDDLATATALKSLDLAAASQRMPEEPGGLNIEGLAATPDGRLLVGFRNPVPNGQALIVPLLNPDEIIAGKRAEIGQPLLLDLGGLGIRDLAMWQGEYVIIAGAYDGRGASRLFRWAGGEAKPRPVRHASLKDLNPEAVVVYPDKGLREVQLLSDDSSTQKDFPEVPKGPGRSRYRSLWISTQ